MVIIENDVISTPLGRRPILRCLPGAPCGKCIFLHYLVALGKEKKSQTKKEIEFKFAYNFQINLFKRLQAVNSFVTGDRNLPRIGKACHHNPELRKVRRRWAGFSLWNFRGWL